MPLYESSERPVVAVDIDGVQEVNYDLFPVHFELIRRHASNLSSEVVTKPRTPRLFPWGVYSVGRLSSA